MRTNVGFIGIGIVITGSADLPNAVLEQEGFRLVPLHDHFVDGITMDEVDFGRSRFRSSAPLKSWPSSTGSAPRCIMLPASADVNDTFVHALATIGLSHRDGFAWQSLPEAVLAGLRRAGPVVERIIDERWESMSDTVNGWRGSLASGRCSYDWSLNAANTKNQVGTELADQVVYLNCRVDAAGQPVHDRQHHRRRHHGRRRHPHRPHPARPAGRTARGTLAARATGSVQPHHAVLRPTQPRPRQELRTAAGARVRLAGPATRPADRNESPR